ncbi:MAG: matrixin family metalloprotease [Patescibacteria group bacterium]
MIKKLFVFTIILALFALMVPVSSQTTNAAGPKIDLPEQAGVYDVPGNPHLKLRVFVHPAKNQNHEKQDNKAKPAGKGKPAPPPPTETCSPTNTADPDSSAVVNGAGWSLPSTWVYRLNLGSVPSSVGSGNLATITDSSYNAWLNAAPNVSAAVSITRGSDTGTNRARLDGQNIITWGRTSGSALATSYVWYYTATGIAAEVDTIMNKKFSWKWSDPATWPSGQTCAYQGVYDAQDILTHELGHTMGLADEYESAYQHNTMYGYGSTGETKKNTLTTGDKVGVENLY